MKRNHDWMLIVLAVVTSIAVLLVILASAFLEIGGWGGLILDLLLSAIVQGVLSLLLLGIVLVLLLIVFKDYFRFFLSRMILTGLFFASAIMSLAFIPRVFSRGLDIYDYLTTVLLSAAFAFVAPLLKDLALQYLEGGLPGGLTTRPRQAAHSAGPSIPGGFQPYTHTVPDDPNAEFQPIRRTPASPPNDLADLEEDEPFDEDFYTDDIIDAGYNPSADEGSSFSQPAAAVPAASSEPQPRSSELYSMTEVQLYNELFKRAGNDHLAAQRLVAAEYGRTPYLSREDLLRNALERLEQDNPDAPAH